MLYIIYINMWVVINTNDCMYDCVWLYVWLYVCIYVCTYTYGMFTIWWSSNDKVVMIK